MTIFDDRKRKEEAKYKHEEEFRFKVQARRNRLFGLWAAEKLGLSGDDAASYAKDVVLADFEAPGSDDVIGKVAADLKAKSVDISDHLLRRHFDACEQEAIAQVKAE